MGVINRAARDMCHIMCEVGVKWSLKNDKNSIVLQTLDLHHMCSVLFTLFIRLEILQRQYFWVLNISFKVKFRCDLMHFHSSCNTHIKTSIVHTNRSCCHFHRKSANSTHKWKQKVSYNFALSLLFLQPLPSSLITPGKCTLF